MDSRQLQGLPEEVQGLLRFVCSRMVHSYKPVLTQIFMAKLPALAFPASEVSREFVAFYRDCQNRGLPVERRSARFVVNGRLDEESCRHAATDVVRLVFGREQCYARLSRGRVILCRSEVWLRLAEEGVSQRVQRLLERALAGFYDRIVQLGEAAYGEHDVPETNELVLPLPRPEPGANLLIVRKADEEAD